MQPEKPAQSAQPREVPATQVEETQPNGLGEAERHGDSQQSVPPTVVVDSSQKPPLLSRSERQALTGSQIPPTTPSASPCPDFLTPKETCMCWSSA